MDTRRIHGGSTVIVNLRALQFQEVLKSQNLLLIIRILAQPNGTRETKSETISHPTVLFPRKKMFWIFNFCRNVYSDGQLRRQAGFYIEKINHSNFHKIFNQKVIDILLFQAQSVWGTSLLRNPSSFSSCLATSLWA